MSPKSCDLSAAERLHQNKRASLFHCVICARMTGSDGSSPDSGFMLATVMTLDYRNNRIRLRLTILAYTAKDKQCVSLDVDAA